MISVTDLTLDETLRPEAAIWTYGSRWAEARTLVRAGSDAHIDTPPHDADDLMFEVQYQDRDGLAYVGFGRGEGRQPDLAALVDQLADLLRDGRGMPDALDTASHVTGAGSLTFDTLEMGVAGLWLEEARMQRQPGEALAAFIARAGRVYDHALAEPVVLEAIATAPNVWIAFQVSRDDGTGHRLDPERLWAVATGPLGLSDDREG
ncbi:MAG: hypothetical protein Q8S53_16255 [Brevundimonas sp.]|uniref:hypothetical protein n=1 Tax=Brevundimonas sp. TaxID=1871086 RepID=UPI0027363949|nr:hypothetical protein [Brevundimonas sp.]MDP3379918.1 hypothetical protein [Brevundimonas sp.]